MGKRETVYEVAYSTRLSLPVSWLLAGTSRISRWALTSCVCQRGAGEGDLPGGRPMYQSETHTPNPRFKSTSDCYRMRLPNRDVRSRRNCRMPGDKIPFGIMPSDEANVAREKAGQELWGDFNETLLAFLHRCTCFAAERSSPCSKPYKCGGPRQTEAKNYEPEPILRASWHLSDHHRDQFRDRRYSHI